MIAALLDLWHGLTDLVGIVVVIIGMLFAVAWLWCKASDWLFCEGRWMRCAKCGERTKVKGMTDAE